jgi:class 3 adenylate cyclase
MCGSCGATNEPGERFCGECGQALDTGVAVGAQGPSPEGERKQVTVLFADVERSMDLAARLDPEELAAVMGRLFALCAEGVERFEGTVVTFTGDGVMALFGAPLAYEDHARRACLAGLHLQASVSAYAAELLRTRDLELRLRVGLHSGEVVAGMVGDSGYTAVGHAVGMAQRVQALGEPGMVCLSEGTARLVAGDFDLHDLGRFEVKGAAGPVAVFSLTGSPGSNAGRRFRGGGSASLVGRDAELADLVAALERARCGQAQVVGIVGEAGVGKSRLCDEFARHCTAEGVTVRRAAGLAHARSVPLLPILAWLRDSFAITDDDAPAQAREKIAGRVVLLDPALLDDLGLLFDFLEVPDPARPAPPLGPEARQRRILDVLRRVTNRRSERETLVVVLEDLHWFDPQSAAFLERLIPSYPGTRTLVVTNFRPEFQAAWMGHSYYRQMPLAPLAPEATSQLFTALAGADSSLAPLAGPVATRTGGNPFFIEEVVRSLAEDGTLQGVPGAYRLARPLSGEIGMPASVQAVLAARIDRLPKRERAVLQTASVVGRTFSAGILAAVVGLPSADLDAALVALCAAELLQETGGSREYRFWHPLTQEVAYGTLLGAARHRLHAAVAQAIVALDPDRLDERAALVADHYEAAGESIEAAGWNDRAASWSLRTDLGEAQRRWRATISLLSAAPETPESVRLGVHARSKLLRYLARSGVEPAEADRLAEEARCMATSIGDPSLSAVVMAMEGTARIFRGEVAAYLDFWREVLRLADALGDTTLRSFGAVSVGLGTAYVGPLADGLAALEAAGLSALDPTLGIIDYGLSIHDDGHMARCLLLAQAGDLNEAGRLLSVTRGFYRERPSPEWNAWTLSLVPRVADWTGEPDDTVAAAAHEAVRLAQDSGFVSTHVTALQAMGVAELLHRNPSGAAATFDLALKEARERRSGLHEEASLLAYLARALLAIGDDYAAKARAAADEAVAVARRQGARVVECAALATRARVLRETSADVDQARVVLDAADRLAADTGAATYAAFLAEERARLDGDDDALADAARRYRAIGATGHALRLKEADLQDA